MGLRNEIMDAIKDAMRAKDQERLNTLRLMKAAILLKEKSGQTDIPEEELIAAMRAEIKKRQQTLDVLRDLNKAEELAATEREIAIIEEYLPKQLSPEDVLAKVKEYAAAHPEIDNPGRLTGAMKKELGDLADGRVLNEACKQVLGG